MVELLNIDMRIIDRSRIKWKTQFMSTGHSPRHAARREILNTHRPTGCGFMRMRYSLARAAGELPLCV